MSSDISLESPVYLTLESSKRHSVVSTLIRMYPALCQELSRARACIVEYTYWPDDDPDYRNDDWQTARQKADAALADHPGLGAISSDTEPFLICYVRLELARRLGGRSVKVAGIPVMGWIGIFEGGMHFHGSDGSVVRSEDWEEGRLWLEAWCRSRWMQ